MINFKEVYYSMGGMAQYIKDLTEILNYRIDENIKRIKINTSSQPNSIPHMGTIIVLMLVFKFAENVYERYKIETIVEFDAIECAPGEIFIHNNSKYAFSIKNSYIDGVSILNTNMKHYHNIMNYLKDKTNINYYIRTFSEFQNNPVFKSTLYYIIRNESKFAPLFFTEKGKLHIRGECPICMEMDKDMINSKYYINEEKQIVISGICTRHGSYEYHIDKFSDNFVEVNTQLRDLIKGAIIDDDYVKGDLTIMMDGGDWGGTWANRIHCEGMQLLNRRIPIRMFTPLIIDRSGGKLSKSIYMEGKRYSYINDTFDNYDVFTKKYGNTGMDVLFQEVSSWTLKPERFFRNYSIDYLVTIMKKGGNSEL